VGQYLERAWGRKLVQVNVKTGHSSTLADGFEHPSDSRSSPTAASSQATGAVA
jgi:hypothetical protein